MLATAAAGGQTVDQLLHQLAGHTGNTRPVTLTAQDEIGQFLIADMQASTQQLLAYHLLAFADGHIPLGIDTHRDDTGAIKQCGHGFRGILFTQQGGEGLGHGHAFVQGKAGLKAERMDLGTGKDGDQPLYLWALLLLVGEMLAADQQFSVRNRQNNGIIRCRFKQGLQGLDHGFVAA